MLVLLVLTVSGVVVVRVLQALTFAKGDLWMSTRRNLKVLVLEPPNQVLPIEAARPNGALGPAYLLGALRDQGIEADYLDATVGRDGQALQSTFYNRVQQDNGTVRYGMSPVHLAEVFSEYDIVATSSIFTAQTRMHFQVASLARKVAEQRGRPILVISGGVNARALHRHFLANGFDVVALGEGERTIVEIVKQYSRPKPDWFEVSGIAFRHNGDTFVRPAAKQASQQDLDYLPFPALDALPLAIYRDLGIPHAGAHARGVMFAPIQTSRGCQDKCTFCHISLEKLETNLVGRIGYLRGFSKERLGQDVQRAVDLGVTRLYVEDDNLFYNKRRLVEMAPFLKRDGLEYSDVNGANLRFLLKKDSAGAYIVDTYFIDLLAEFGLRELMLPFESRNPDMMEKYASGKYNPDAMDSVAIVRALKKGGMRISGNFMIGFRNEPWESVLRTKEFARELLAEGLDSVGFNIPVPYPGSVDFQMLMCDPAFQAEFDRDPLKYTDRMHQRGRPLFETAALGERLEAAVHDFWLELNPSHYTVAKMAQNVSSNTAGLAGGS